MRRIMGKNNKKYSRRLLAALLLFSMLEISGCSIKETDRTAGSTKESIAPSIIQTEAAKESSTAAENESALLDRYIALLGLTKEELVKNLGEEPEKIDEGGLEFKKAGIRIWFDQTNYKTAEQIFVMDPDFDIHGVKLGEKIDKFKEVLKDPVSDRNGDAHFKYNDIYLSINYDTNTQVTYGLYLLKNDF
ncbi:hypothetical protein ACOAOT_01700 [Lacrimispora sp. AGF001]|uniref:hypothetical protein n=1 Tax=Lacrimispora sp. AGF001 TaxID=3401631 RepID=UPI003B4323F8